MRECDVYQGRVKGAINTHWRRKMQIGTKYMVARAYCIQGIFPTQGLNLGLLHCRWILYHLSH